MTNQEKQNLNEAAVEPKQGSMVKFWPKQDGSRLGCESSGLTGMFLAGMFVLGGQRWAPEAVKRWRYDLRKASTKAVKRHRIGTVHTNGSRVILA